MRRAAFVLGSIYALYLMNFGKDSRFAGFVTGLVLCCLIFVIWLVISYRSRAIDTVRRRRREQGVTPAIGRLFVFLNETKSISCTGFADLVGGSFGR